MDLREIFREGWQWPSEQMIKFWLQSGCGIGKTCLVQCTVPVLLVINAAYVAHEETQPVKTLTIAGQLSD